MKIRTKQYKDKVYLEYEHQEGSGKHMLFTNAEYFMFDVESEEYKNIMSKTGGFVANVTSRYIEKNELDCSYIMLCCIPQEYNDYLFEFLYLDKDKNILRYMKDDNPYDYEYFKDKFNNCTVETGMVYDLENIESFSEIIQQFSPVSSPKFSFTVDGKNIEWDSRLFLPENSDFSVFVEETRNTIKMNHGIGSVLKFDLNALNGFCVKGHVLNGRGEYIPSYKINYGVCSEDEYIQMLQKKHPDVIDVEKIKEHIDPHPFEFTLSINMAKSIASRLSIYKQPEFIRSTNDEEDTDYDK